MGAGELELFQGSLARASAATGRRYLKPGFGFTEEDDLLDALGWPNVSWLLPGDVSPADLAGQSKFFQRNPFTSAVMRSSARRPPT